MTPIEVAGSAVLLGVAGLVAFRLMKRSDDATRIELVPAREKSPDRVAPRAAAPPRSEFVTATFVVFHPASSAVDSWAVIREAAEGTGFAPFQKGTPGAQRPFVSLEDVEARTYGDNDDLLDSSKYLSAEDRRWLPSAEKATLLTFEFNPGLQVLHQLSKLMGAFVQRTGGVILDLDQEEFFSGAQWDVRRRQSWERDMPFIEAFLERQRYGLALEAWGLDRFGLPDVGLDSVPDEMVERATWLLFAVAQTLVEQPGPAAPGDLTVDLETLRHSGQRDALLRRCSAGAAKRVAVELVENDEGWFQVQPRGETLLNDTLEALFGPAR